MTSRRERGRDEPHLEEVGGQAGSLERLLDALGDERGLRRRLEEDRVAGEEGRDEGVDGDHVCIVEERRVSGTNGEVGEGGGREEGGGAHRETARGGGRESQRALGRDAQLDEGRLQTHVPGADEEADADRGAADDASEALGPPLVDVLVLEGLVGVGEEPLGAVLEGGDLGGRVALWPAHLAGELWAEVECARGEVVDGGGDDLDAVGEGHLAPLAVGIVRLLDLVVELRGRGRVRAGKEGRAVDGRDGGEGGRGVGDVDLRGRVVQSSHGAR